MKEIIRKRDIKKIMKIQRDLNKKNIFFLFYVQNGCHYY